MILSYLREKYNTLYNYTMLYALNRILIYQINELRLFSLDKRIILIQFFKADMYKMLFLL